MKFVYDKKEKRFRKEVMYFAMLLNNEEISFLFPLSALVCGFGGFSAVGKSLS